MDGKAILVLAIIGVIGIAAGGWILANYEPQRTGNILVGLGVGGFIMAVLASPLKESIDVDDDSEGPEVSGGNIFAQVIGGFLFSIIPILLSVFTPLSIGIPVISYSVAVQGIVSIAIAPIIEELFFLTLAIIVYYLSLRVTGNRPIAIVFTLITIPAVFAAYHWVAYGATFLVGTAFIGAAIFRAITLIIILAVAAVADEGEVGFSTETVAPVIISLIIMHAVFNAFAFVSGLSKLGSVVGT